MNDNRVAAEAVLAAHQQGFRDRKDPFYCTADDCEWVAVVVADGRDASGVTIERQHVTHQAAALAAAGLLAVSCPGCGHDPHMAGNGETE